MKKLVAAAAALLPPGLLAGCARFIGDLDTKSASIGIIGGADGPTAIFVTANIIWPVILLAAAAAAVLIVLLVRHFKGKK